MFGSHDGGSMCCNRTDKSLQQTAVYNKVTGSVREWKMVGRAWLSFLYIIAYFRCTESIFENASTEH
jgi:hypothetical protein